MVAFSHLALILAGAGFSVAQSFSALPPSDAVPSGGARPTGGFPGGSGEGGHGHGGEHSGFAHPTGGFHSHGPKPSGTGVFGAQRAEQSGKAPFPSGVDFSALPSGAARPSGHHGHHGKGGKGDHHSGQPSGVPTALPSLAERAVAAATDSLGPKPTGARPSGARSSGARPSGARPSGARPPKASGSPPPRPSGRVPTGARPSGPPPSGKPTAPPAHGQQSTFVTSVTRKA